MREGKPIIRRALLLSVEVDVEVEAVAGGVVLRRRSSR